MVLNEYTVPFLILVGYESFFIKGFIGYLIQLILLPYYNDVLGAEITEYHRSAAIIAFPWAFKQVYAILYELTTLTQKKTCRVFVRSYDFGRLLSLRRSH